MRSKKIIWVTGECFTETDYNYPVMKVLCEKFEIHWYIINGRNPYLPQSEFDKFKNIAGMHVHFKTNLYRFRDLRAISFWYRLHREIQRLKPDVVYYNMPCIPAYILVSRLMDPEKHIFAAHDGKAQNDSDKYGFIRTLSYNMYYRHAKYVNMFSKAQTQLMHETYPHVKVHTMVLPLKDFGHSNLEKPKDIVRFLSFGRIIYQKNIDLLIQAGNKLYERGYRDFRISINGKADDWEHDYAKLIKYPEVFECNPEFVDNEKLLDLFATSHYSVFPYRRVSQSGVLKLAFNYKLPVLVSRTGAFMEEVKEGINGYFFEPGNLDDLTDKMEMLLINHSGYASLIQRMSEYINQEYSVERIAEYYSEMFENKDSFK